MESVGAGVTRKTSKGLPTYDDNIRASRRPDVFCFLGSEDLVPIAAASGRTEYRPRTEGAVAKIIHHHDAGDDH